MSAPKIGIIGNGKIAKECTVRVRACAQICVLTHVVIDASRGIFQLIFNLTVLSKRWIIFSQRDQRRETLSGRKYTGYPSQHQ